MIRYLSYYSIGGYKDIYIGTNQEGGDEEGKVYYSTFLQPWLEGQLVLTDEKTSNQLEQLKLKPQMEVLTKESRYQMPKISRLLTSHAGYRVVCCSLTEGGYTVVIRDILGNMTDEFGRLTPFVMQFICDESRHADNLFNYIRFHLEYVKEVLGGLFSYNSMLNCIVFDIATLNSFLKEILEKEYVEVQYSTMHQCIRQIILSDGVPLEYCIKELGFTIQDVAKAYDLEGNVITINPSIADKPRRSVYAGIEQDDANTQEQIGSENDVSCVMRFLTWLKTCKSLTVEDRKDLLAIRHHMSNILKRKHY